ncbi:hypothetical protein [Paenibacillus borealis]|uniref:Uncharacterized protein n=1 Tax=Paenibacillus borealis TaxID=160799 RepID=A0A089MIR7_PAEBO|nr:hypothetical protein [Paenibacillus borealis]AIQ56434.1 hypothetical protein PBOR_05425 [Paenibacillus borealis]
MDIHKKAADGEEQDREDLITERDIDEESGLFQEGTYPGALPDKDQKAAINHAVPKEGQT